MSLSSGTVFGQYRIGRKLGSGGMGEVYQATHLSLAREVALKTLRADAVDEHFSSLIQEARATSALDHPNIVRVYDVAEVDGTAYIAMEYIEGQTLRQVLAQRVVRLRETLQYAVQIANALAAAHDAGVLHRDVKPGNIMITRRNVIKVVDFGLAKRFDPPEPRKGEDAPTRSIATGLLAGRRIEGTVGYMSPEQIEGLRVDARSDIFSFGIVLYEMLTRARPFNAPSDVGIAANILHADPRPAREIAPDVPEELDDLVRFCLRKAPEDRARSMHDVAHMLEAAQQAMERQSVVSGTGGKRRRWLIAGGIAMLALIAAGAAGVFAASRAGRVPPRATLRRITWDDGLAQSPALSNDGSLLAFSSDRGGNNLDIFVRHMSGGEPVRLTNDSADDTDPSFSPDGGLIAFRSERQGGGVYVMPSLGGQERLIVSGGSNPRFSPDGNWIAYWVGEGANSMPSGRIYVLPASGGTPRQLQPKFADARYPVWTPDGAHIIFQGIDAWRPGANSDPDWWVTPLDSGQAVKTGAWDSFNRAGLSYIYPIGGWRGHKAVFSAQDDNVRSVFEAPISGRTWRIESRPESLTFGTGIDGSPYPAPGGAVAFTSFQYEINIWSRMLDGSGRISGRNSRKITTGAAFHSSISMSADGMRMVFLLGRSPRRNVWIRDLATQREAAVDFDAADKCSAIISADGSRVAWSVCGPGKEAIYTATVNSELSARVPEKVCEDCGRALDWSRAGDSILFVDHSSPVQAGILSLNSKSRSMVSSAGHNVEKARFSPDGKWIALTAAQTQGDRAQIFVVPVKDGKPVPETGWVVVTKGDFWDDSPVWTERGDAILFYSRRDGFGCIWRQAVNRTTGRPEGEPSEVVGFHTGRLSLKGLLSRMESLSLANNQIFFNALESTGSIWMLDHNPPDSVRQ